MELTKRVIGNVVFAFQVLLLFLLVFEQSIEVPAGLQAFGRAHPLLLHLPIGLLMITTLLVFVRKWFDGESFVSLLTFLLYLTAFTASTTALMGLFLSREGGYLDQDMFWHKWLGVALSFLTWLLIVIPFRPSALKPVLVLSVMLLVLTGHFGANLTHGENFVLAPLQKHELKQRILTDSSTLFTAVIDPIFEAKCYSCHNTQKAKGKLVLTSLESIAKGGKHGPVWKPGNAMESLLTERLLLPIESKEHMPPKDKAQLTEDEIRFISLWIEAGADTEITLAQLHEEDTLKALSALIIPQYHSAPLDKPTYTFQFASTDKIKKLSTPNRSVFQIARNEPALQVDFFLREYFNRSHLEALSDIKDQLVTLNLSNMPVKDEDLKVIRSFTNLEKLLLNKTDIMGEGLKYLSKLNHLTTLSLSGTKVSMKHLEYVAEIKNVKQVFLWNTSVDPKDIANLEKNYPSIRWQLGYIPDEKEVLQLNPPFLQNDASVLNTDEPLILKHNLPGTEVRYAINSDVDSIKSATYREAIQISGYSVVKAKAFKPGWKSSKEAEFIVFKKGFKPDEAKLITPPDDRYPGEGSSTFIDNKKGLREFYKDPAYIAFRNNPMAGIFTFKEPPAINSITLSYARNIWSMCMPPEEVEVWAGDNPGQLKLLKRIKPQQPTNYVSTRVEGFLVEIPDSKYACYKIVARPLSKMPKFRNVGNEKGWLMMDEIFFN